MNDRDTESDAFLGTAFLNATREVTPFVAGNAIRVAVSNRSLEWVRRALANIETECVVTPTGLKENMMMANTITC